MTAGRKRAFDEGEALNQAIKVFWQNGYSNTSLIDLTTAMGINKPSLYAAFGNKEALFLKALDCYLEQHATKPFLELYKENTPLKERMHQYLLAVVSLTCDDTLPGGCMMSQCAGDAAADALPAKASEKITTSFEQMTAQMVAFFADEQAQGNISDDRSPEGLVDYLTILQMGIATSAKQGASQLALEGVVAQALGGFQFTDSR